jgi:hypothetical protein
MIDIDATVVKDGEIARIIRKRFGDLKEVSFLDHERRRLVRAMAS